MTSGGKCTFSTSLAASLVGVAIGATIGILLKFIFRKIKVCIERRRRLSTLPNVNLELNENTSPGNPPNFCPCDNCDQNTTHGYVPVITDVTNNSVHINSDMDRDIKSGIAHRQELQDLEAAIPQHHAF